jgi:ATP-dependent Clp protease ATP-binding subunit ClpA
MATHELGTDGIFPFALGDQFARQRNSPCVRPEHLLLAMLHRPEGRLPDVARFLNLDFKMMHRHLEPLIPPAVGRSPSGKLPTSPEVKRIREFAISEARQLCQLPAGPEHLLLALTLVPTDPSSKVLTAHGLTGERLSNCLRHCFAPSQPENVVGLRSTELEAWQQANVRHQQKVAEQKRLAELRRQVHDWTECNETRALIKAVTAAAARNGISVAASPGLSAWVQLASGHADQLDPVRHILPI